MNWQKEPLGIRATRHSGNTYSGLKLLMNNRDRLSSMIYEFHAIKGINLQYRGIEDPMLRALERGDYLIGKEDPEYDICQETDAEMERELNLQFHGWLEREIRDAQYLAKKEIS